jgi:hypothetical protein
MSYGAEMKGITYGTTFRLSPEVFHPEMLRTDRKSGKHLKKKNGCIILLNTLMRNRERRKVKES